jgi:hypothetical protein
MPFMVLLAQMSGAKIKHLFVQISKTSLIVIFLISILLSSASLIVANFGTKKAYAAAGNPSATFNWENYVTITGSDGTFWTNTAGKDGITKYILVGDADPGCADYIEINVTVTTDNTKDNKLLLDQNHRADATVHILTPSTSQTNKNCQDVSKKITLGNTDAIARLYYWESATTIRRLQGYDEVQATSYTQSKTDPTLYIEDGGAQCPDLLYVNADKKSAKYLAQTDVQSQIQDIGWLPNGDHIYWHADNGAGTGCYDTKNDFNDPASTVSLTLFINSTAATAADAKGAPSTSASTGTKDANSCYGFSPFSWMLCPILDLADGIYGFGKGVVKGLLYVEPTDLSNTGLKQSWSIMRNFSSILIVLVALVMIASQVFSFEFMSAYTIKKVLPRLVIAAILIQLSWFIFTTLVILMNALGSGLYALLTQPFVGVGGGDIMDIAGQIKNNSAIGSAISQGTIFVGLTSAIAIGGLLAFTGGALLSFILVAVGVIISVLVAIFTLIVRKILILLLLTLAPLALVAWILPNTQRFWDMWWKLFSRLLLMFPLIMLLFASGVIAANVLSFSTETDPIKYIIIIIAYFAPLFLVPSTFKFAGGMFTGIVSAIDKAGSKAKGSGFFGMRDQAKANRQEVKDYRKKEALKDLNDGATGYRGLRARYRTGTINGFARGDAATAYGKRDEHTIYKGQLAKLEEDNLKTKMLDEQASERIAAWSTGTAEFTGSRGQYLNVNDKKDMATVAMNGTVEERRAALRQLQQLRGDKEMRQVDSYYDSQPDTEEKQQYIKLKNTEFFASFRDVAPDLAKGGPENGFKEFKPNEMRTWSPDTITAAVEHISTESDPTIKAALTAQFDQALQQLADDPTNAAGTLSPEARMAVYNAYNGPGAKITGAAGARYTAQGTYAP